jgi:hypothetical protein
MERNGYGTGLKTIIRGDANTRLFSCQRKISTLNKVVFKRARTAKLD